MNRSTFFTLLVALFACAAVRQTLAAEREYFWNEVTNATQWEDPNVPVPYEDQETGKKYYVDPKTGESTWEVRDAKGKGRESERVLAPRREEDAGRDASQVVSARGFPPSPLRFFDAALFPVTFCSCLCAIDAKTEL